MVTEQSMTRVIIQVVIEAAKAAIIVVREENRSVNNARPICVTPRSGCPSLRQPTFYLKAADKSRNMQL